MAIAELAKTGLGPEESDGAQIAVSFKTKLPAEFRVPDAPITVPANLTRYGLSQIINHLLTLDPSKPFDFLINGELVRLSLHKHLLERQITTETVLEIEYVPAVLPPEPKEQHPHDDWVSTITDLLNNSNNTKAANSSTIVTGCYDGLVRLWSADGEEVCNFVAHKGPVKAATRAAVADNEALLLTTGDDCVARAWKWSKVSKYATAPEVVAVLKGHSGSVETIAAAPSGNRCATGGWDNKLLLWRSGASLVASASQDDGSDGSAAAKKKRKVGKSGDAISDGTIHEERPLSDLEGHTQCISGIAWPSEDVMVSCSWDHSIRTWDLEVQAQTGAHTHNKAVHCVAVPFGVRHQPTAVAFGGAEKTIRVWDPRQSTGEGFAISSLTSHTDWVSALAWHPTSHHHLMSASYDKTAKLWDIRSTLCPLHTLTGHTEKLLCCAWVNGDEVATGGADSVMKTAKVEIPGL